MNELFYSKRSFNKLWKSEIWYSGLPQVAGQSQITLSRLVDSRWITQWSRALINNWAPQDVFLSDSGKWVITIGEVDAMGFQPLWACYNDEGQVVVIHSKKTLPREIDSDLEYCLGITYWGKYSISDFSNDESKFYMILKTGVLIIFGLDNRCDAKAIEITEHFDWDISDPELANARDVLGNIAAKYLDSDDPYMRYSGAIACGNLRIANSIERLKCLLQDDSSFSRDIRDGKGLRPVYFVREAAIRAIEQIDE